MNITQLVGKVGALADAAEKAATAANNETDLNAAVEVLYMAWRAAEMLAGKTTCDMPKWITLHMKGDHSQCGHREYDPQLAAQRRNRIKQLQQAAKTLTAA